MAMENHLLADDMDVIQRKFVARYHRPETVINH